MSDIIRIETMAVLGPTVIQVTWKSSGRHSAIDLAGWIGRGNPHIAPLADPAVFARASVGAYGGNVTWDGDEGDLAIDAIHLEMIAEEQAPFATSDAARWQTALGLSDQDVGTLLGILPATSVAYKSGAAIPTTIARLCRAVRRDPVILDAHLRPAPLRTRTPFDRAS